MQRVISLFLVMVAAISGSSQITYPPNMYPDAHAPYLYGVASGDPLPGAVVIWTKIGAASPDSTCTGTWHMALDSTFQNIVHSGSYSTDSSTDFTVNIDVQNLNAGTVYYYRFTDAQGNVSCTGRTKTAATGNVPQLNVAVMSCSSVYSGYFNAYRRLGQREVLDAVIHLGDYVYDFVDEDEQIRVPDPYPQEPANLAEWRALQQYYLMDPDLRLARQNHPWVALWDNHDRGGDGAFALGNRAFREYLPIRRNNRTDNDSIFRKFSFGNLLDIWITDVGTYRTVDTFPNGEYNLMGHVQLDELIYGLKTSTATWKIMGSQKMTGGWYTTGIDPTLLTVVPNDGNVFDNSSWDGYSETRNRIWDSLQINHIDNFMALSGDAHISMAMDLVKDPYDSLTYNPATGTGAIGVEFLPSSISRGNLDESGVPIFLVPFFEELSGNANPHHVYMDGTQHGYGLLTIRPDSINATFCYSPILELTSEETYKTMVVKNGKNHWERSTTAAVEEQPQFFPVSYPYPNPTHQNICVDFGSVPPKEMTLSVYASSGQKIYMSNQLSQYVKISVKDWAKGIYMMELKNEGKYKYFKFVVD